MGKRSEEPKKADSDIYTEQLSAILKALHGDALNKYEADQALYNLIYGLIKTVEKLSEDVDALIKEKN